MITLGTDRLRQRAAKILLRAQTANRRTEVVARPPAQLRSRQYIDVHAIDASSHRPAPPSILLLELGHIAPHHRRSIQAQLLQIIATERRRGADDVSPKANGRRL